MYWLNIDETFDPKSGPPRFDDLRPSWQERSPRQRHRLFRQLLQSLEPADRPGLNSQEDSTGSSSSSTRSSNGSSNKCSEE